MKNNKEIRLADTRFEWFELKVQSVAYFKNAFASNFIAFSERENNVVKNFIFRFRNGKMHNKYSSFLFYNLQQIETIL